MTKFELSLQEYEEIFIQFENNIKITKGKEEEKIIQKVQYEPYDNNIRILKENLYNKKNGLSINESCKYQIIDYENKQRKILKSKTALIIYPKNNLELKQISDKIKSSLEKEWYFNKSTKHQYYLKLLILAEYDDFVIAYVNFNLRWEIKVRSKRKPTFYLSPDLKPISIIPAKNLSDIYIYLQKDKYYSEPSININDKTISYFSSNHLNLNITKENKEENFELSDYKDLYVIWISGDGHLNKDKMLYTLFKKYYYKSLNDNWDNYVGEKVVYTDIPIFPDQNILLKVYEWIQCGKKSIIINNESKNIFYRIIIIFSSYTINQFFKSFSYTKMSFEKNCIEINYKPNDSEIDITNKIKNCFTTKQ